MARATTQKLPPWLLAYVIMTVFLYLSLGNHRQSRVAASLAGMFRVILGIVSAYGLASGIGVPSSL